MTTAVVVLVRSRRIGRSPVFEPTMRSASITDRKGSFVNHPIFS